jgi:hypothetical protein
LLQQTLLQPYERVAPVHSGITPILHEWSAMLAAARASAQADRYASVVTCVLETLANHATIRQLVSAYQSPDAAFRAQVYNLCGVGRAHLDPRVVVGAACALRFRQLMDQVVE